MSQLPGVTHCCVCLYMQLADTSSVLASRYMSVTAANVHSKQTQNKNFYLSDLFSGYSLQTG